jgi:hypothetical protein
MILNVSIVFIVLYFISMIMATAGSMLVMRQAYKHMHFGTEVFVTPCKGVWVKRSFIALFLYYFINLVAECLAWTLTLSLLPNYAVYTFNYAINIAAIFIFFAINVNNKIFRWFLLLIYGGFLYAFISYKLWINATPIPFMFGVILFSGMAVISIPFLASNLISHSRYPNRFKIHLGIIFLVYNFLAVFITAFMLDFRIDGIGYWFHFFANTIIATSFYLASGIVLLKLYKMRTHAL